jgi:hypothetical protein
MALAEGGDDSSETDTDDSDDSSEYFRTGGGGGGPHTQHAGWRAYFHTAGVLTAESKSKYAGSTLFGFVQPSAQVTPAPRRWIPIAMSSGAEGLLIQPAPPGKADEGERYCTPCSTSPDSVCAKYICRVLVCRHPLTTYTKFTTNLHQIY